MSGPPPSGREERDYADEEAHGGSQARGASGGAPGRGPAHPVTLFGKVSTNSCRPLHIFFGVFQVRRTRSAPMDPCFAEGEGVEISRSAEDIS